MQCAPNLLIISNKNKKTVVFVTYTKQKEYLCGKFYSYETKDIRKTRVFQSYRTHVWTCIIGGNRRFDIEKVMENAVYIHLSRMGYKVYVGQMYKAEIDFVAEKADSVAYVQVTYLLASEETVEREFGNLKLIKDSHPKYVISMDRLYSQTNIDGIKHIHLRDFLKMTTLV